MHPRLKSFLLFLGFAVLSQIFEPLLSWLVLVKAHAVNTHDVTWRPSLFIWFEGCVAVGAIAATWFIARIGRRSMVSLGYTMRGAARQIASGSLWGLAAVVLLVAAIATFGGYSPGHVAMSGGRLATYATAWLAAMFGIGLAEEATFRGAGLFTLGEAIGPWPAALVISIVFGAIHFFGKGPAENLADALSVGLIGLFVSFTVIRTGAIWFAVGFHALFDYTALYIFGAPNSGNRGGQSIATKLLTGGYHGPAWLTGGPLGVEASWLVFPVIALLFVGFHLTHRPLGYNPPVPAREKQLGGAA